MTNKMNKLLVGSMVILLLNSIITSAEAIIGDNHCDYPTENHVNSPEDCNCRCSSIIPPGTPSAGSIVQSGSECNADIILEHCLTYCDVLGIPQEDCWYKLYDYCEYDSSAPSGELNCFCYNYRDFEFYYPNKRSCEEGMVCTYADCTYLETTTCDSCRDCKTKLNGDYSYVKLSKDVQPNHGLSCCVDFGADKIVFDCDGHTITQTAGNDQCGIRSEGKNNIAIKNCILEDFTSSAINLIDTSGSLITNNEIHFGGNSISLDNSAHNEISYNTILDSGYIGISVQYRSNFNIIKNNRVERAAHVGIAACTDVENNLILDNTVILGSDEGVCLCANSHGCIIENNFACYNAAFDIGYCQSSSGAGIDNTCDPPDDGYYSWNDEGHEGCTYSCPLPVCGSTICEPGETAESCPIDCGKTTQDIIYHTPRWLIYDTVNLYTIFSLIESLLV